MSRKKQRNKRNRNGVIKYIFKYNELNNIKPIRNCGNLGMYEIMFYDRVLYIDKDLNVKTSIGGRPLLWRGNKKAKFGSGLFVASRLRTKEGLKYFKISLRRLVIWLYGDKDGASVSLLNEECERGQRGYVYTQHLGLFGYNPSALKTALKQEDKNYKLTA